MYIVTEIQTNADGTIGLLNWSFGNRNEAEAQYHRILAAAAASALEAHAAIMFSGERFPLRHECYRHDPEPVDPIRPEED